MEGVMDAGRAVLRQRMCSQIKKRMKGPACAFQTRSERQMLFVLYVAESNTIDVT